MLSATDSGGLSEHVWRAQHETRFAVAATDCGVLSTLILRAQHATRFCTVGATDDGDDRNTFFVRVVACRPVCATGYDAPHNPQAFLDFCLSCLSSFFFS